MHLHDPQKCDVHYILSSSVPSEQTEAEWTHLFKRQITFCMGSLIVIKIQILIAILIEPG